LRQWLTEGVVLAVIGGAVGVVMALWIKSGLMAFIPNDYRVNLSGPFEWRLYAFILAVAILLGLAFSLAPAIQAARQVFAPGLRLESRSFTSAGRLLSLRSGLILVQVALSLPLLFMAAPSRRVSTKRTCCLRVSIPRSTATRLNVRLTSSTNCSPERVRCRA
jgi:hypothetical protein